MTRKRPIIQINDDDWVTVEWVGQHEECCGCGMKHTVDYRVHNGKLQFKAKQIRGPQS